MNKIQIIQIWATQRYYFQVGISLSKDTTRTRARRGAFRGREGDRVERRYIYKLKRLVLVCIYSCLTVYRGHTKCAQGASPCTLSYTLTLRSFIKLILHNFNVIPFKDRLKDAHIDTRALTRAWTHTCTRGVPTHLHSLLRAALVVAHSGGPARRRREPSTKRLTLCASQRDYKKTGSDAGTVTN